MAIYIPFGGGSKYCHSPIPAPKFSKASSQLLVCCQKPHPVSVSASHIQSGGGGKGGTTENKLCWAGVNLDKKLCP